MLLKVCRKGSTRTGQRKSDHCCREAPEKGSRAGQRGTRHLGRGEHLGAKNGPFIRDSKEEQGCAGAQVSCEQKRKDSAEAVGPSEGSCSKEIHLET